MGDGEKGDSGGNGDVLSWDRKKGGGEILFLTIGQGHGYFFFFLSSLKGGITSSSTSF